MLCSDMLYDVSAVGVYSMQTTHFIEARQAFCIRCNIASHTLNTLNVDWVVALMAHDQHHFNERRFEP